MHYFLWQVSNKILESSDVLFIQNYLFKGLMNITS